MKNILSKTFLFSTLLLAISCKNDTWDYSYPLIKTVGVENFNDTSAVFRGKIELLGNDKIVDYGYVVDYVSLKFYSHKEIKNVTGMFEIYLSSILRKDKTIRIAAYAKTNNKTVVGQFIYYKCTENVMPEIESITPISGNVSTIRTIVIKNFCEFYERYVWIDGSPYNAQVTFIAPNKLEIKLNPNLEPGSHSIRISNYGSSEYPGGIIVTE